MISYCPSCGSCLVDQKCPNCIVKPIRAEELPDENKNMFSSKEEMIRNLKREPDTAPPGLFYLNEREKMHP